MRTDRDSLEVALLRAAHRANWPTMVVQFAASIGVYLAAQSHAPSWYNTWITIVLGISAARVWVDRRLADRLGPWSKVTASEVRLLGALHSAGLLGSAFMWALLAWVRLPLETVQIQFMVIVVLSALVGGASGVLAPLKATGRIYVVTILGPACVRILMSIPEQQVLGVLGLVFLLVILGMHRNNHLLIVRSIDLASENLNLVAQLKTRNDELAHANQTLEDRVSERTGELKAAMHEAQSANRLKSEFLATISHEVRTPLNAVLGMVQIMAHSRLPKAQEERLAIIRSAGEDLLRMFSDILDLSRIEAGTLEVAEVEFDPSALLERLFEPYRELARAKGLEFRCDISDGAGGRRRGDAARLEQILGHLLSNAVKYTERGGIVVGMDGDAAGLVFRVTDTGIGVPQEARARIFERFVQADGSNTRRAGGLGLGLSLSRDLALQLGGTLTLETSSGQGSCFVVQLPMARSAASIDGERPRGDADAAGQPARVLVVDDNAVNRTILVTLLSRLGGEVQEATDGAEAVEAWRTQEWDAILMDINMPVMDGIDATRHIRAGEAESSRKRTPIIAVTANARPEDARGYLAAGMDHVMAKPIDAAELVSALTRHTQLARAA